MRNLLEIEREISIARLNASAAGNPYFVSQKKPQKTPLGALEVRSPFPFHEVPRVWDWMHEVPRSRLFDDDGPKDIDQFLLKWERMLSGGMRTWAVYRGVELGGVISFTKMTPIAGEAHCVFKKAFWGHGTTRVALIEVFNEIFGPEHEPSPMGVDKIWGYMYPDNGGILALLNSIGGEVEAKLERHTTRGGEPVNLMVVGIHKENFYVRIRRIEQQVQQPAVIDGHEYNHAQPDALPVVPAGAAVQLRPVGAVESDGGRQSLPSGGAIAG